MLWLHVNKNSCWSGLLGLALTGAFSCSPVFAQEAMHLPVGEFHVRQTAKTQNGVWQSAPDKADEQMAFFLETNRIRSLDDYARWLKENISYQRMREPGPWNDPQKTLTQGFGDCKNFASLTHAVLRVAGYSPQIMASYNKDGGHAFCVFESNGRFYWFDNATLKKTSALSLPDFEKELIAKHKLAALFKLNATDNRWEMVYQRSS